MSRSSSGRPSANNSRATPRRHRFWVAAVAALALGAAAAVLVTGWPQKPEPLRPSEVVVALPTPEPGSPPASAPAPPPAPTAAANAPSQSPAPVVSLPAATAQPATVPQTLPSVPAPSNEQPAWLRFAAAVSTGMRDRPRVAIVIDDLGLDRPRTERVIGLPAAVTLSFLPYSQDLPQLAAAGHHNGHEMIVHVPMQPIDAKIDMGPNGLATNLSHDEVLRRLDWDLARFDGYVGINNHMGSRFTEDAEGMGWVMDVLKARGLMFLDSRTIGNSVGAKMAASAGVPFTERDVFLDDDQHATAVEQRLKDVETIARKKGVAVAIGHPHDATIAALITWIASLPQKNIVLVPLTEIVKAKLGIG